MICNHWQNTVLLGRAGIEKFLLVADTASLDNLNYLNELKAIPFEKVVGGVTCQKKNAAGWSGNNSDITAGWSVKMSNITAGCTGITTGPLYYCGVVTFFHPPKFYWITPSIFM